MSSLPVQRMDEIAQALRAIGAPVFLSGMSRGLLGPNDKLHIRQNRSMALRKADVVILAGVTPDFRLDYGRGLPRKGKVVSVNLSRATATKNSSKFCTASCRQQPSSLSSASVVLEPSSRLCLPSRRLPDPAGPGPARFFRHLLSRSL